MSLLEKQKEKEKEKVGKKEPWYSTFCICRLL
ncbi:hypothetical protein RDI58_025261 [Solanum bulbocastanum]|uniref:Uncharacterized protein n=1 Tax=Solanum bulbocastanum TaxID=147425 RepID=A0AAN8Y6F7_SOLBU